MNVFHLELLVVCDNIENQLRSLKDFEIYHLVREVIFHAITLSKAFETFKKTPVTSSPSSKDTYFMSNSK